MTQLSRKGDTQTNRCLGCASHAKKGQIMSNSKNTRRDKSGYDDNQYFFRTFRLESILNTAYAFVILITAILPGNAYVKINQQPL